MSNEIVENNNRLRFLANKILMSSSNMMSDYEYLVFKNYLSIFDSHTFFIPEPITPEPVKQILFSSPESFFSLYPVEEDSIYSYSSGDDAFSSSFDDDYVSTGSESLSDEEEMFADDEVQPLLLRN